MVTPKSLTVSDIFMTLPRISNQLKFVRICSHFVTDTEAYLQIELDKESQKLGVINTHKGLFQYSRLPYGISSAPSIFLQFMDQIFQGLNGVQCHLDDIIVTGKTEEEHMHNLQAVLQRIKEYGLRLRKEKCSFLKGSVEYLGHVISSQGIHPSPKNIEAIQKIAGPTNVTELWLFILPSFCLRYLIVQFLCMNC